MKLTQCQRIKRALDQRGPRGVSPTDFSQKPTIDGGPPILRVAARIDELRKIYDIARLKGDDGCALYLYAKYLSPVGAVSGAGAHMAEPPEPASVPLSAPTDEPASLFDPPPAAPRSAIYEDAA